MITYFAAVAKYNVACKEFRATRKFLAGTLYKRPRKELVAFDVFMMCLIDCFTAEKIDGFVTEHYCSYALQNTV